MKKILFSMGSIPATILLSAMCNLAHAQTRTVSGTVTSDGKPISGVIIFQEGSKETTISTSDGNYQINLSGESQILIFRHPKYQDYKLVITDNKHNVELFPKENSIEEVIINAGYYKVKDKERTGSIAKVSAKDIENQPVTNVLGAVQGRMAGVSILQNSGTAGGGYDIQIRGRNSLRSIMNSSLDGNQPLYVIDGVPIGSTIVSNYSASIIPFKNINPLNNINPNDIESIEVLKDADATSIYGSRGANGVILVTTKKGMKGNLSIMLNTSYGMSKVASYLEMMNSEQYLNMRRQAFKNAGVVNYPVTAYDVNGKWDQTRYTDWQKELIGNWANLRTTHISINGGGERSSFLISIQNSAQTTVFPAEFGYKTNLINSNFTYFSKDRKFNFASANSFSILSNNVVNSDLTNLSLNLSPVAPALYDDFGNLNWEDNTFNNPLANFNGRYQNKTFLFNQNLNLSYEIFKGVSLKINTGVNYQTLEEYVLKPHTMTNPSFGKTSYDSSTSKSNNDIFTYIMEPQANWLKNWENHELNILVGSSFQKTVNKSTSIVGVGFASNALMQNLSAAVTKVFPQDIRNEYRYASLFGRLNYQFKNRYILNLTARRDGSSRFGDNNKFANFGAIGAAWLFSKESFLNDNKWLSFGKIRTSYGTTGSDFIGDYQYIDSYTVSGSPYNGNIGLYPSRLYNPNFSWETTTKSEAGLELGFFKDKLSLVTAYYHNKSKNQLVGIPLPGTTGFSSIQANLDATVQNTGWEFQLTSLPLKSENWKWQTSFNISFPETKLVSFPGLQGSTYSNTYVVGMPTNIVKLYNYEGINPQTGQYLFTDYNQDGKITSPDDAKAVRKLGTEYFGGWHNDFKYKNINLSPVVHFK